MFTIPSHGWFMTVFYPHYQAYMGVNRFQSQYWLVHDSALPTWTSVGQKVELLVLYKIRGRKVKNGKSLILHGDTPWPVDAYGKLASLWKSLFLIAKSFLARWSICIVAMLNFRIESQNVHRMKHHPEIRINSLSSPLSNPYEIWMLHQFPTQIPRCSMAYIFTWLGKKYGVLM